MKFSRAVGESTTPAKISWTNNRLLIASDGSGLNSILRDITAQTGLKVSGSVADEPIFGTYGPDTLENVVAALLEGLPVNLLLAKTGNARDLILTPRSGGVTPPIPSASRQTDPDNEELRGIPASQPTSVTAQPINPVTGEPASPNGVRTPADILRQLQGQHGQPLPPPR